MNTQITLSKISKQRNSLEKLIEKKRKILDELMADVEMLKVELDLIKHEYHVRVGKLLLKDNQLDLEILQLKNMQELMKKGMTFKQALKSEEESFYNEILQMQKEQEKIQEEQKILDSIQDVSEEVSQDIKTLWKKLIRVYHPDLALDPKEKEKKEEIMKKINLAYTENNLQALLEFETQQSIENLQELTKEQMEETLSKIENMILDYEGELRVLKASSWYEWKKKIDKSKTTNEKLDVFADLENKFLDDIVKKIEVAQKLRAEVIPPGEEFFI